MIAPWQAPLIVMAALAVLTAVFWAAAGAFDKFVDKGGTVAKLFNALRDYARTSTLAAPTLVLALVALGLIGPEITDKVTQIATSVSAVIGAIATYRSYRSDRASRKTKNDSQAEIQTDAKSGEEK